MESFVQTLKQLGVARLAIMGAIILGMLLFFTFVSFRVSSPDMKLLYSDLSNVDSSAVAAKLEENQIPFRISPDGSRVEVPEDQVGRSRMLLAAEGLPNGGNMGYELFDEQSGFGTTNFVQNINQVRALEGELARTISSLENIRSARVHLVLPQRELFSREERQSSASVFLGLRPGAQVDRQQIAAIQSLVASGVPGLSPGSVSLIDNNGNLLARGGEETENMMGLKAEELRRSYESRLTQKIQDQVASVVGFGKARVTVTAEMNFDRISTNEELFDPEGQVLRSTQVTEENNLERDGVAGDVSVENNLPGVGGDLLLDESPSLESSRVEEVSNFEISRTVRSTVREVGEIRRLSLAVLVDGRYITDAEGNRVYEPRSQEELNQIEALVRSAAGFDERRGDNIEIVNMQFADVVVQEEYVDERFLFGFEKGDLIDIAEIMTISIMIILVVLLILQPMVGRLLETEHGPSEEEEELQRELLASQQAPALAAPDERAMMDEGEEEEDSLINIHGVEGKVKASSIKKVEEIVENYPNEAVSVIRSWMTQEG